MKISGIYKIESKIKPGRIYIGSAINISCRWKQHLNDLRNNRHGNSKLQRHYNKYGKSDLLFSILLGCKKEDLIKNEQYFLDSHNIYFNICKIAGSPLGTKRSDETRKKMSISCIGKNTWQKGRKASDETKRKMSESHKGSNHPLFGTHWSEETRKKSSESHKGHVMPKEQRDKLRKSNLGRKLSKESKKIISEKITEIWRLRKLG